MITNVLEYLEATAERLPNKDAYVDEENRLTFLELREQSKKIGTVIANLGISRAPVMVFMKKCAANISCFMGVLYSGNYYAPIDITMPEDRIMKILSTLHPAAILTDSSSVETVRSFCQGIEVILYEDAVRTDSDDDRLNRIKDQILDIDPAYVLFTSGSTGQPKGVLINHRGIIDFTDWMTDKFQITDKDNFANQSPFFFDLSIGDLYCTLKTGCTNYIVPTRLFTFPIELLKYLNEKKITIIFWVPSALCVIANLRALNKIQPEYLTRVLFCGEVMPNKQLNVWRRALPDVTFANLYGPCETVDASTYYIVDRDFEDDEPLPIGVPCKNTGIIVLNEEDREVKGDEIGELCIRGCSLALGYYNDPERTDNSFTQNPLIKTHRDLIYRTGDLVRYNEYGELMYVGRKDYQIKHMGHRIELGEIETALDVIEEVETKACIYDDIKKKIVVFYKGNNIEENDILKTLEKKVPEYMVPNEIICLNEFPYNANGKIDRKELKKMYQEQNGIK